MGRWKEGAKEFTVKVSYAEGRGFQLYFPVPLMERWGRPDHLTIRIRGERVTVEPAETERKKTHGGGA